MLTHRRLVCIPARDATFAREAERIAARIPAGLEDSDALAWFEAELRRSYPTALVREQSDLGRGESEVEEPPVWYVTRRERFFRIDVAVRVPLDPAAAFDLYVHRVADWQTAVRLEIGELTPDLAGSTYRATYEFLGRRFRGVFRILAADRPNHVTLEAAGSGIRVWYTTRFIGERGGTRVHIVGDYELPSLLLEHVADRLGLERAIARDIDRANDMYRALCEAAAAERREALRA